MRTLSAKAIVIFCCTVALASIFSVSLAEAGQRDPLLPTGAKGIQKAENNIPTNYSWLGLFGLLGLAGFLKRNARYERDTHAIATRAERYARGLRGTRSLVDTQGKNVVPLILTIHQQSIPSTYKTCLTICKPYPTTTSLIIFNMQIKPLA